MNKSFSFSPSHSKRSMGFYGLFKLNLGVRDSPSCDLKSALFSDSDILSFRFDKMAF